MQFYPFVPSNIVAPSLIMELDGVQYRVVLTWNVSAQRYYINIYGLDGTWIVTQAVRTSPPGLRVGAMTYDPNQKALVATIEGEALHWRPVGQIIRFQLDGFNPTAINGRYNCMILNAAQFQFAYPSDPGAITSLGSISSLMDMAGGYFNSSLILRSDIFEVRP